MDPKVLTFFLCFLSTLSFFHTKEVSRKIKAGWHLDDNNILSSKPKGEPKQRSKITQNHARTQLQVWQQINQSRLKPSNRLNEANLLTASLHYWRTCFSSIFNNFAVLANTPLSGIPFAETKTESSVDNSISLYLLTNLLAGTLSALFSPLSTSSQCGLFRSDYKTI